MRPHTDQAMSQLRLDNENSRTMGPWHRFHGLCNVECHGLFNIHPYDLQGRFFANVCVHFRELVNEISCSKRSTRQWFPQQTFHIVWSNKLRNHAFNWMHEFVTLEGLDTDVGLLLHVPGCDSFTFAWEAGCRLGRVWVCLRAPLQIAE